MEAIHQDDYYTSILTDSRNMIIKGKRTKRPRRPSSPLSLTMASTSSTTTASTQEVDGDHTQNPYNNMLHTSTKSNIEFTKILQQNDEEEDMANCLILLAQSHEYSSPLTGLSPLHQRPLEGTRTTSGVFVYECKTCNRGFSSFQALGGHRASHKKPSSNKPTTHMKQDDHVLGHPSSIELSLQIGSSHMMTQCNTSSSIIKVAKIHECSTCGAEFGSGQALGGHMRRHRSMPMTTTNYGDSSRCQESKKPKTQLSLDLNLPAPVEDDLAETNLISFRSKDQMIMFSNSSLVHCYI